MFMFCLLSYNFLFGTRITLLPFHLRIIFSCLSFCRLPEMFSNCIISAQPLNIALFERKIIKFFIFLFT